MPQSETRLEAEHLVQVPLSVLNPGGCEIQPAALDQCRTVFWILFQYRVEFLLAFL